jgi:hypothetical protein
VHDKIRWKDKKRDWEMREKSSDSLRVHMQKKHTFGTFFDHATMILTASSTKT